MYQAEYQYAPGETIWITDDDEEIFDSFVVKVQIELDHDVNQDIIQKNTYHLLPLQEENILLKSEREVFGTAQNALKFLNGLQPEYPFEKMHSIDYTYTVNDLVWIIQEDLAVECRNTQTTILTWLDGDNTISETYYHLLPLNEDSSVLLLKIDDIYPTKELAVATIKDNLLNSINS